MSLAPNMRQRSVPAHSFAMVPKTEVPRSTFPVLHNLKTTLNFSYLSPIFWEHVLPGDHWNVRITTVARTAIPIVPIMDNWHFETFAFFVPNRLVWNNWVKFMGEQDNPGDSISYTMPIMSSPVGGASSGSLQDLMQLPITGQIPGGNSYQHISTPMRAYNLIYNTWFRDENLQNSVTVQKDDGPDSLANYSILKRGKRHDYFTSALPWPQKGNTAVTLPLGTTAPVQVASTVATGNSVKVQVQGNPTNIRQVVSNTSGLGTTWGALGVNTGDLVADLSSASAATVNALRLALTTQQLLEIDARGGTRYTEIVRAHFGVISPDARLQRPEYIGGGHVPVLVDAIPQTSASGLTGGSSPMGTLAATGHAQGSNGFSYAATEHGIIIVLAAGRADLTYQQGLPRKWSISTRYDWPFPVFANLGEQTVLNKEIFCDGSANDALVFGYQERYAEWRYLPNKVTGLFRTTTTGNIGYWHSAQQFGAVPTLNSTFIQDDSTTVLQRNFAAAALTDKQQLLCDIAFTGTMTRALPAYGVPGLKRF